MQHCFSVLDQFNRGLLSPTRADLYEDGPAAATMRKITLEYCAQC